MLSEVNTGAIFQKIGRIPLVPLHRIARGLPIPVFVKCEYINPGGSVKDLDTDRGDRGNKVLGRYARPLASGCLTGV